MVSYQSKQKCLNLEATMRANGKSYRVTEASINLECLTEPERQMAIQLAKVIVNFCNGQRIGEPKPSSNDDNGAVSQSQLDVLSARIKRVCEDNTGALSGDSGDEAPGTSVSEKGTESP